MGTLTPFALTGAKKQFRIGRMWSIHNIQHQRFGTKRLLSDHLHANWCKVRNRLRTTDRSTNDRKCKHKSNRFTHKLEGGI